MESSPVVTREDRDAVGDWMAQGHPGALLVEWTVTGTLAGKPEVDMRPEWNAMAKAFAAHREAAILAERHRVASILHEHHTSGGDPLPFDVAEAITGGGWHPAEVERVREAVERAVKAERDKVVAWLRDDGNGCPGIGDVCDDVIAAIEKGQHA